MFDPAPPDPQPTTRGEWVFASIMGLVALGLFGAEVLTDFHPGKFGALCFLLFWMPLVALHEAGHALAAAALGWRVREVVIGFGRPLWTFNAGGTPVRLRLIPISGYVVPVPTNLRGARLKEALIYAAGPGIELALAGLVLLALGRETLFSSSAHLGVVAGQALALAATTGAVINLLPGSVSSGGQESPTDGLGILLSALRPSEHYAEIIEAEARREPPPEAGE